MEPWIKEPLYNEALYNEPISPVPWHLIKSRFHCITVNLYPSFTSRPAVHNLVPRVFSLFKMALGEPPGRGCQSGFESSLEFRHANTMKCLRFARITVSDCRKQTGSPDAGNNLRKSHFIVCHVQPLFRSHYYQTDLLPKVAWFILLALFDF